MASDSLDLSSGMISKLQDDLPAPLQRVLGSTGLNVVSAGAYTNPQGLSGVASVDPQSVNTVEVNDPKQFVGGGAQTLGHESTHLWQNNLPPAIQAMIPRDVSYPTQQSPEQVEGLRAQGKNLATVGREMGPTIIQSYLAQGGKHAPAKVQAAFAPWLNDMKTLPLSTIIPTSPGTAKDVINTAPRAPLPQF